MALAGWLKMPFSDLSALLQMLEMGSYISSALAQGEWCGLISRSAAGYFSSFLGRRGRSQCPAGLPDWPVVSGSAGCADGGEVPRLTDY